MYLLLGAGSGGAADSVKGNQEKPCLRGPTSHDLVHPESQYLGPHFFPPHHMLYSIREQAFAE